MRYIRVYWNHEEPDDPVELLSELDAQGRESRKVERFRSGPLGFADHLRSSRSTKLGLVPVPPLEEINQEAEFQATEINRDVFERAWVEANLLVQA